MEIILALDFDGTLFKLEEHDSEEMLMSVAAISREEISLMDRTIQGLRSGDDPRVFEEVLRDMLIGKPLDLIKKAIDKVVPLTDSSQMAAIRRIASRDNVHLHIVSCGTDMLISEFLHRFGLLELTEGIHAKELLHGDDTFTDFIWHITGPEDKKLEVEKLRESHENSMLVVVGDGFTDGPMLSVADRGYLIEWPGGKHHEMDAERIYSFRELEERLSSFLD